MYDFQSWTGFFCVLLDELALLVHRPVPAGTSILLPICSTIFACTCFYFRTLYLVLLGVHHVTRLEYLIHMQPSCSQHLNFPGCFILSSYSKTSSSSFPENFSRASQQMPLVLNVTHFLFWKNRLLRYPLSMDNNSTTKPLLMLNQSADRQWWCFWKRR